MPFGDFPPKKNTSKKHKEVKTIKEEEPVQLEGMIDDYLDDEDEVDLLPTAPKKIQFKFKCPFCTGSYKTNDDLKAHIIDEERSKWLDQKDPIHTLKTPDELFKWFQQYYDLPLGITRKDYEKNPKNLACIDLLKIDIRKFMIRYKRSKIDMDLYYDIIQRFEEYGYFEKKAKGEY